MDENEVVTGGADTGAEAATGDSNAQGQKDGSNAEKEVKTYSEKDFQSEVDKRVTEALKTANAKSEAAFEKRLADARADWEKESKMTAEQREKAAAEKTKAAFEKEKADFAREKLIMYAERTLIKNGLPSELAANIAGADEAATEESVSAIKAAFDKAVEAAVTEKLKGNPPDTGGQNNPTDAFLSGFGI